jgi:hypothetical protein
MWKLCLSAPTLLALALMSWAQLSEASPAQTSDLSTYTPAPGTLLKVELANRLDAKHCRVNDKVEATLLTALPAHSQTQLPRKTKIVGHVTEVKAHSKTSPGPMLGIIFDQMLLKDGRAVPLPMTVRAIIVPPRTPAYASGPDTLADRSPSPYELPPVGAQAPATGSSDPTPDRQNIPAPPSINPGRTGSPSVSQLSSTRGEVVGTKDFYLDTAGPVSTIRSSTGNLHLETGTQLILRVQ